VTLAFRRLRFDFHAGATELVLPPGKAANVIRGALGMRLRAVSCPPECRGQQVCLKEPACVYRQVFHPTLTSGPSGLADPPRPFVLRVQHLNDCRIPPGASFHFYLHVFVRSEMLERAIIAALAQLIESGLGPTRGSVRLEKVTGESCEVPLQRGGAAVDRVEVRFLTPTELKGVDDPSRPDFGTLFARLRDRISSLRGLYGAGPLPIDFRRMGERAAAIRLESADIRFEAAERRSTRTGQSHPLGGWVGSATYSGDLREFLPFLEAGRWTGVGRQTVWGKGEIAVEAG
jgi:hypothetical protein